MIIVETVYAPEALPASVRDYTRHTLTLPWLERCRSHCKHTSDQGLSFAISLPLGTFLKGGEWLVLEEAHTIVEVIASPQPVYVIRPQTPTDWAYYAYHLGNRHQSLMIVPEGLVSLRERAVQAVLEQWKIPYTEEERPFTAIAATAGHAH